MSDYIADETGPDAAPIDNVEQLLEHIARGVKTRAEFRIGTEYEKVAVDRRTGAAIPFSGRRGVESVLHRLADRYGWEPHEEEGRIIALSGGRGEITLEPGGQIELSGEPYRTLHEADDELREHVQQVVSVADELDVAFLGLGMQPISTLDEIEWVPKKRYRIMAPYMRKVGTLGHRMMKQTATVQVNLDFESESDAMLKMRVATGIGPILNALFANSPISDGKPNGYLSYRGHIWTDTDNERSGILPFVFEPRAGFEDYVEWALDVPMYFVKRRSTYHDLSGIPFRRFWKEGAKGLRATVGDFALHLSTLFPEVRLKTYIELRMVDSQPPESMLALSAIAKGVLYESDCMLAAWDLVKDWTYPERLRINQAVHRTALATPLRKFRIQDLARELVGIAEEGLRRQDCRDARGSNETMYLDRARDYAIRGKCPAELVLERWNAGWPRDASSLVMQTAYRLPDADR